MKSAHTTIQCFVIVPLPDSGYTPGHVYHCAHRSEGAAKVYMSKRSMDPSKYAITEVSIPLTLRIEVPHV